jgi:hypothetical protein
VDGGRALTSSLDLIISAREAGYGDPRGGAALILSDFSASPEAIDGKVNKIKNPKPNSAAWGFSNTMSAT